MQKLPFAIIERETEKALLVFSYGRQTWLPKSQIKIIDQFSDKTCSIELPEWLMKKNFGPQFVKTEEEQKPVAPIETPDGRHHSLPEIIEYASKDKELAFLNKEQVELLYDHTVDVNENWDGEVIDPDSVLEYMKRYFKHSKLAAPKYL